MQEPPKKNEVVASYGDWRVCADGEIRNVVKKLKIYPDRLREPDWWAKLHHGHEWMAKEWNDFIPAWAKACEQANITEITIKTEL